MIVFIGSFSFRFRVRFGGTWARLRVARSGTFGLHCLFTRQMTEGRLTIDTTGVTEAL